MMSKRPRTTPKFWHTLKINDQFMLIMHETKQSNQGVKLRQDDGALWEAFGYMERCENLYDDMHTLDAIEIEEIIRGSSMTPESFRIQCDPQRKCSFHLNGYERLIPISTSDIFRKDVYSQILDGTSIPELIAAEKKTDDEMTADLFVKYKHIKRHDHDYNMTCYTSIRLTLARVPEFVRN